MSNSISHFCAGFLWHTQPRCHATPANERIHEKRNCVL